ncbi:MAG: hypothetical protein VW337_00010 [Gammaproteobacteria bacterium]
MKIPFINMLALASAIMTPVLAMAQNNLDDISCTRGGLQNAVDLYVAAQASGDISNMPLPSGMGYWENEQRIDINSGLINKPMQIDHHMSLLDQDSCQTFTEVIVNDAEEPYVLGTRMRVNHDKIAEIEIVWTTTDYWLFNAEAYLSYSSSENWGPIRAAERASRGELVSAANAYLDAFLEGKIDLVPWGFPCVRVEGGAYTGRGSPDDSCEVGVPAGVNIANRRFVVDEVIGSVVVYCTFGAGGPNGGSGSADTHLFRVENGRLRYVHTLTHLLMSDFQGGGAD